MAVMPRRRTESVVGQVARASAETYELAGERVVVSSREPGERGFVVVVPGRRRIEEVCSGGDLRGVDLQRIQKHREAGFEVWFLVPLASIGQAHMVLQGFVDRLQPWWIEGDEVRFGSPRVP